MILNSLVNVDSKVIEILKYLAAKQWQLGGAIDRSEEI